MVDGIDRLLKERGHTPVLVSPSSNEIQPRRLGLARAFFAGIYNPAWCRKTRALLRDIRPDVVHIHNLYPLLSPSILPELRRARVPVVMTVHNYRLVCPNAFFWSGGTVCERCSGGKEWWCILRNCQDSFFKSVGYSARNYFSRINGYYLDNVTVYAALSDFQKGILVREGFPRERILVIPNMTRLPEPGPGDARAATGDYVGFVGRISPEKGLEVLLGAASLCKEIPFRIAGSEEEAAGLPAGAPENVRFCGALRGEELERFYRHSRVIALPSLWYEGFPNVVIEAMARGKPVICSDIGGLREIVDEAATGYLFQPGNPARLAERIRRLWQSPETCRAMGERGREKARSEYSPDKYHERLMHLYATAIRLTRGD